MPKIQHNFRLDATAESLLTQLAEHLGLTQADVVRQAIRQMARRELPKAAPEKSSGKSKMEVDTV